MPEPLIEQAILVPAGDGWQIVARSPGWQEHWFADAARIAQGFGTPTPGEYLSLCVFAQPLGRDHVAVVQAAAEGSAPQLQFHFLVLRKSHYAVIGDPIALADHYPPSWDSRIVLPSLMWNEERSDGAVERLQRILQEDDSATLLGAAQALVDGGRIVFERPFPAPDLLRRLWALLPDSTRVEVWPATYLFAPGLNWHVAVVPHYEPADWPQFLTESQAGDYPEGRYELNLQIAVEAGDQAAVDRLLARRSSRQTLRLAIMILLAAVGLVIVAKFVS